MYYKRKDGYITRSTSDPVVASRCKMTEQTDEEIVMQGDGSGYVLASEYVAPDTRKADLQAEYDSCVSQLKEYMATAMLMADTDLQSDLQSEYADLTAEYDTQLAGLEG